MLQQAFSDSERTGLAHRVQFELARTHLALQMGPVPSAPQAAEVVAAVRAVLG